ncbi:AraC family transcriptional regulator [uncultured Tateyamaria sp.]|uniref:AraC family transcriptional regulator n=1 Tax=uncultured Tateyamaria sp. TaxID=455651 RepID=UPI00262651FE|nr:AraC family transcriptional regulator [uncultured Tateyamaria sp.]
MSDTTEMRYKIARTLEQVCGLLQIDPRNVLRRMHFPADFLEHEGRGVTPADYFAGWHAMLAEAAHDDTPLMLGQAYARGPFNPAFFAFTCSPTVAIGLERLALFKPLTGPLHLALRRGDSGALSITKSSNVAAHPLPDSFAATELVFVIEAIRTCTGHHIVPRHATLPGRVACHARIEEYLGCDIGISAGASATLRIAQEDADRPLLSADPDQWAQLEPSFQRQMQALNADQTMSARVCNILPEMLPGGEASVQAAAARLRMSARSLQRHLKSEGTGFQTLLDATRADLARHYLATTDLTVEEISYLLAYSDPNSFYRAFQTWTGETPKSVRMKLRA